LLRRQEGRRAEGERVALNLHVAFLHDVEEADLDFSGEVGEFVDAKIPRLARGKRP